MDFIVFNNKKAFFST